MMKFTKGILVVVLAALLFSCKKKFDDYYERPSTLEPPIYQVLEKKGNFKSILAAIDKSGYKPILSAAGFWTFFAPHDSAFQVYLTGRGLSNIADLDSATCRQIVTYNLVYNGYEKERLDDYQANTGWVANSAFRRRTANYTFVYDGKDTSGNNIKVIASNRNGALYADADNNNKHIPYFIDGYMSNNNLGAADYNYFYPSIPYTGFNVVDAVVTQKDIPAENGVIHVVNKVINTLPSIDQYLEGKPEYSLFKSILDKFLVTYILNPGITDRYRLTTGQGQNVYTKVYSAPFGTVAYSLNNENYLSTGNDAQRDAYTIFVPTNDSLDKFIKTVLLENYPPNTTLKDIPTNIVYDLVNAHLSQKAIWPSKFGAGTNFLGEATTINPATDVVEKKILSNGFFYGTKKVQEANVFTSVYGRAYLDPNYSMMTKLLNYELRFAVSDVSRFFTMFLISDAALNAAGFFHDPSISNDIYEQYRFIPPTGSTIPASTGATTRNRLLRILNLHVVPNRILTDLNTEGVAKTVGGEFIGFKNNTIFGSGNVDANQVANVTATKTSKNGRVYYIDKILNFTESLVGAHIEKLGTPTTSQYNYFWQFLKGSSIWNNTTKEIAGVAAGTFYTILIPNNTAIMNAVKDTLLPGNRVTGVPNFAPTTTADQAQVIRFIYHHFVDKNTIAADGVESGAFPTLLKNSLGDPTTVFINNSVGSLLLTDMNNRTANVISAPSYYLTNRAVIHLINNYLKYID